jgi:replicative DNA helicase
MSTSRELLTGVLHRLASETRPTPSADLVGTGYPSLDRALAGGLRCGELTMVGGDAGAGKSALVLGIAIRAAVSGTPVLILSSEGSVEHTWERIVSAESGVTHIAMRTGVLPHGAADSIRSAADVLRRLPITVEQAPYTPALLSERLEDAELPALVIIDGLVGIDQPPRPVAEAQAQTIRLAKRVALDKGVALIVTTALSADRTLRPPPRPMLNDFGIMGTPAAVADVVLAVFREALYDDTPDVAGAFEVHVLKHRSAPTGFVDLYIEPGAGRVEDLIES